MRFHRLPGHVGLLVALGDFKMCGETAPTVYVDADIIFCSALFELCIPWHPRSVFV